MCGGLVELGHELTVGVTGCGQVRVAFFELEARVEDFLFQADDLLVERVGVGGCAQPGECQVPPTSENEVGPSSMRTPINRHPTALATRVDQGNTPVTWGNRRDTP
jgi:hypothetical protein